MFMIQQICIDRPSQVECLTCFVLVRVLPCPHPFKTGTIDLGFVAQLFKIMLSICRRALRLPPLLHHGWIYCKNQWKRSTEECQWRKNISGFLKYVCWVANRSEAAHNGSGIVFFELPSKMCKVCIEAVHRVALRTRTLSHVWACVKYVPKQRIA